MNPRYAVAEIDAEGRVLMNGVLYTYLSDAKREANELIGDPGVVRVEIYPLYEEKPDGKRTYRSSVYKLVKVEG